MLDTEQFKFRIDYVICEVLLNFRQNQSVQLAGEKWLPRDYVVCMVHWLIQEGYPGPLTRGSLVRWGRCSICFRKYHIQLFCNHIFTSFHSPHETKDCLIVRMYQSKLNVEARQLVKTFAMST